MNAITEELDRRLKLLPPASAASVSKLVRDVLDVVEAIPRQEQSDFATVESRRAFWAAAREDWGDEPFERPSQGEFESREEW